MKSEKPKKEENPLMKEFVRLIGQKNKLQHEIETLYKIIKLDRDYLYEDLKSCRQANEMLVKFIKDEHEKTSKMDNTALCSCNCWSCRVS